MKPAHQNLLIRSHCVNDLRYSIHRQVWPLKCGVNYKENRHTGMAKSQGGRIKEVFLQEIKCDFAGTKRGGRNNRVAVRRGSTVLLRITNYCI